MFIDQPLACSRLVFMSESPQIPQTTSADSGSQPDSRTIGRLAVRNSVWVSLGSYLNLVIGFISNLILIRLLTPEIFGFFSMATFWASLFNLRPKVGIHWSAIRHPEINGALLGTYFVLDVVTIISTILLCSLAGLVMLYLGYERVVILSIIVVGSLDLIVVLVNPLGMALEKELQLSRLTLMGLIGSVITYLVAIVLAASGAGIWSLLATGLIPAAISLFGTYWICKRRLPHVLKLRWRFDKALAIELIKQGLTAGLSSTALGAIVLQYDNFLVGTFAGYTTLGYYDRAYRIAGWTNLLLTLVLVRVGYPTFTKVQNDRPRLAHAVRLSVWVAFSLGSPITLVLLFGASDLVRLLYGAAWLQSAVFLPYLTLYSLVFPFVSIVFWLSVALGHQRVTVIFTLAQVTALVAVATPLTLRWGVMGTIAGVMFTMILSFLLGCAYIFRTLPLSIHETIGLPALAGLTMGLVLWGLRYLPTWTNWAPPIRLALIGGVGPTGYLVLLFLLNPAEFSARIRYLIQMFKPVPAGHIASPNVEVRPSNDQHFG